MKKMLISILAIGLFACSTSKAPYKQTIYLDLPGNPDDYTVTTQSMSQTAFKALSTSNTGEDYGINWKLVFPNLDWKNTPNIILIELPDDMSNYTITSESVTVLQDKTGMNINWNKVFGSSVEYFDIKHSTQIGI